MRVALWATLAALGAPLPLLSLSELALLVCDRFVKGTGAVPLLLLGGFTLWNTPIPPLPFLLLFCSLLLLSLSHAFPTRVPLSPLHPLALVASLVPLLRNPSLAPILFAAPVLLLVAAQRSKKSAGPADEAWLGAGVLSLVLSFTTRAHPLRAAADSAIALGVLGALISISPSPPAILTAFAVQPLQFVAPPMLVALIYALLSSPYSSLAPLLPFHGIFRVVLIALTSSLVMVSTLYRRFLPVALRSPLLIAACGLLGFVAAQAIHGMIFGALSAALLVLGSPRTATTRVPGAALSAALLMLFLCHRAAPHLPFLSALSLAFAFFLALLSAAWMTAPRLAPKFPPLLATAPPALLALLYTFLETSLQEFVPHWARIATCVLLGALVVRLPTPSAWLVLASAATNATLVFVPQANSFIHIILLELLFAVLLFPLHFRPSTRNHFAISLAAALCAALLCALTVIPSTYRLHALLACSLAAAPALWAWHHSLLFVATLPVPLVAFILFSAHLIGISEALFLTTALALSATRPRDAASLAAAAAGAFLVQPASLRTSLCAAGCGALWSMVLLGQPLGLAAEAALGILLLLLGGTTPAMLRSVLYLRVLSAAAAVHIAALLSPPPVTPSSGNTPLSLPQPFIAPIALVLAFAALRLILTRLSSAFILTVLTPLLLLAPPVPFVQGRYTLSLGVATTALIFGTFPSLGRSVLHVIAAVCALGGSVPLIQATRVLSGIRSRAAALWLIPLPLHVFAVAFGSLEARLLGASGAVASVWLAVSSYRKNQRDLAAL